MKASHVAMPASNTVVRPFEYSLTIRRFYVAKQEQDSASPIPTDATVGRYLVVRWVLTNEMHLGRRRTCRKQLTNALTAPPARACGD